MVSGGIVLDVIHLHRNIMTSCPSRNIRCFQVPTERTELESAQERMLEEFLRKNINCCATQRAEGVPVYSLGTGDIGWVTSVTPAEIIIFSVTSVK